MCQFTYLKYKKHRIITKLIHIKNKQLRVIDRNVELFLPWHQNKLNAISFGRTRGFFKINVNNVKTETCHN